MARDMEEAEKYLMELEKEITCSICQEHYTLPKALPCLHCYCKHCILKLVLRTGNDQPFSCPDCRNQTTLPEGNVDNLKTGFSINRLKELYAKQKRDLNKDNIAAEKRKELMESLRPLRKMAANLSCAVEEIQTMESELAAQRESVANTIGKSFEELHSIIERHKQKMLEEAKKTVCEDMEKLEGQKQDILISLAELQSIVDYTEQCVKHCSNDEVMCAHAEMENRIQQKIIEDSVRPGLKLTPMEEVDVLVEVSCAEALEQLLQTQAKMNRLPITLVINTVSSKAEAGKLSEVVLCTTQLCGNKPAKRAIQIDCHMKCLHSGAYIKSSTEEIGADQYRIQFTPSLRGQHELTISVEGHQVAGSPFPVLVSIPHTQLDEPVKVWGGVTRARGITVNSVGELIVAEYRGDVMVLDREGKILRSINDSEHKFQYLQGIAVDSEDNIYFTDADTNRIFKSNKNCSKVQVHRVQQVEGPGHRGIAVVGGEVMVTERGNGGRIMVYDRELKYVRQIVGADKNTLWGLSLDSHQNVYVSGYRSSSIQVFSNDGAFLHSFGCDEDGVKRLESPCGVCVAGQYVYVADGGVRKIVMFTTEGDYVTSFGSGHYWDVCVDQDGLVYASDFNSNKIDIF